MSEVDAKLLQKTVSYFSIWVVSIISKMRSFIFTRRNNLQKWWGRRSGLRVLLTFRLTFIIKTVHFYTFPIFFLQSQHSIGFAVSFRVILETFAFILKILPTPSILYCQSKNFPSFSDVLWINFKANFFPVEYNFFLVKKRKYVILELQRRWVAFKRCFIFFRK